jgi:hypothetical protein
MSHAAVLRFLRAQSFTAFVLLLIAAGTGCYSAGHSRVTSTILNTSEASPSEFGRMGLLLPEGSGYFDFRYPRTTGQAFLHTAEETIEFTDLDDGLDEIAAGLVLSGTVGLIGSAITGVPKHQIEAAEKTLRRALEEQPLLPGITNRLHAFIDERGLSPLMVVPEDIASRLNASFPSERDYSPLLPLGIDSVMEFVVERHGFGAPERGNPPMMMEATIHIYITRVSDGTLLFSSPVEYRGHQHRFTHWAAEDARKFRGELKRAGRMVSRSIVDQVFPLAQAELKE